MPKSLNRITYVEDEPDIRAVAELALTVVGGFEIDVCINGADAIAKAPDFQPDLILLDVMMPGLDGPSTLGALRAIEQLEHTPVIFMTAKVQRHEVDSFLALGAIDVIPKPFDPMTLAQTITEIWTRHIEDTPLPEAAIAHGG